MVTSELKHLSHRTCTLVVMSPRLSIHRRKRKFFKYGIMNSYDSTEKSAVNEMDEFYKVLEREYDICAGHDIKY